MRRSGDIFNHFLISESQIHHLAVSYCSLQSVVRRIVWFVRTGVISKLSPVIGQSVKIRKCTRPGLRAALYWLLVTAQSIQNIKQSNNRKVMPTWINIFTQNVDNHLLIASPGSVGVIPDCRALSQNSRLLSHKRTKIRKYIIRGAQNIQNFKNQPNNRKVMMFWKN